MSNITILILITNPLNLLINLFGNFWLRSHSTLFFVYLISDCSLKPVWNCLNQNKYTKNSSEGALTSQSQLTILRSLLR